METSGIRAAAAAALAVLALAAPAAAGTPQGWETGPAPAAAPSLAVFPTLPFGLGEVDTSLLGVSLAELETVGPSATAQAAGGGNLLVVDDGSDCPNADFPTIQAAVTAASPGATIKVCRGVYLEQVEIPAGKDGLTLFSAGALQAVIKAPPTIALSLDKSIVHVAGARDVTLRHFTITGPGPGPCDSIRFGVYVSDGGSALITHNHITLIQDTPFSGCQNGIGVLVGRNSLLTTGFATVTHNLVDRYQKGGVVVDGLQAGPPSVAEVAFNEIAGIGPTTTIAQNGVQVSRNAVADVHHNEIYGNDYALPTTVGEGILLFEQSGGTAIEHNRSYDNDDGVGMFFSDDVDVAHNRFEDNDFDGIYADSTTAGNTIAYNHATGNGEHDCHDNSAGAGTAGTANVWNKNHGLTQNRPGLCKRATVVP
jgi:nitrous oxidase accessory protein NosD